MLHLTPRGHAAFGFCFRFESNDDLLVQVVEHCYGDLAAGDRSPHVIRAVRAGDEGSGFDVTIEAPDGTTEQCGSGRPRSAVLELICWEVNGRARASVAALPVLHAAVIGGRRGAIALCGISGSGKSTLAAAAALRGWCHLSDDMGLVDPVDMTIAPYARPIMVRAGGREHLGAALPPPPAEHLQFFPDEWFVPASALGARTVHTAQPLLAVGFLHWHDSAALEPISRARTLHDLTLHSATVAAQGAPGFAALERVARSVPGYRVGLGAATDVLRLLAPLIGESGA